MHWARSHGEAVGHGLDAVDLTASGGRVFSSSGGCHQMLMRDYEARGACLIMLVVIRNVLKS